MKWFAETTEWSVPTPNHIYLLNDSKSKMFAYKPFGQGKIQVFKKPIRIDIRGRKFIINPTQFKTTVEEEMPLGRTWEVKGSRGDVYKVSEQDGHLSCTCSGFRFRGKCRHVAEVPNLS